jgi:hypothetical protein
MRGLESRDPASSMPRWATGAHRGLMKSRDSAPEAPAPRTWGGLIEAGDLSSSRGARWTCALTERR